MLLKTVGLSCIHSSSFNTYAINTYRKVGPEKTEFDLCYWSTETKLLSSLTSAVLDQCVAVVTMLTVFTGRAISVVQALETLAGPGVT